MPTIAIGDVSAMVMVALCRTGQIDEDVLRAVPGRVTINKREALESLERCSMSECRMRVWKELIVEESSTESRNQRKVFRYMYYLTLISASGLSCENIAAADINAAGVHRARRMHLLETSSIE